MMHHNRIFITNFDKPETKETLAHKLIDGLWTGRTAFICGEWLFANDSINLNGVQEYAVFEYKNGKCGAQVESITVSWMKTEERFLEWFARFTAPGYEHEVMTNRPIKVIRPEEA